MSTISMGQLVNDAKELVQKLKDREKNVDQVVTQSNALAKKVDAIQQLENELLNLNEKANHKSKIAVLSSIQKENKVIKLLQQENEDLKESLEEHKSVLELIMNKYRQQMLQLILLKEKEQEAAKFYNAQLALSLQEKTDKIAEMSQVMRRAIEVDERETNEKDELIQSLIIENRGLKELFKIKNRYNGTTMGLDSDTRLVDKECQTDQILNSDQQQKTSSSETTIVPIDEQQVVVEMTEEELPSSSSSSPSSSSSSSSSEKTAPSRS